MSKIVHAANYRNINLIGHSIRGTGIRFLLLQYFNRNGVGNNCMVFRGTQYSGGWYCFFTVSKFDSVNSNSDSILFLLYINPINNIVHFTITGEFVIFTDDTINIYSSVLTL